MASDNYLKSIWSGVYERFDEVQCKIPDKNPTASPGREYHFGAGNQEGRPEPHFQAERVKEMRLGIFIGSITLAGTAIIAAQLSASGENGADRASTTVQIAGGGGIGPDVTYQEIQSTWDWGQVGDIRGYSLGSFTCNIGDQDLLWGNLHEGTPVLAMNAYRLYEGQLLQIGMSWVKHACCAAANNGCGPPCNGNGGSVLGVGCRDIYSASWNGSQSRLGRRSEINAYTGDFVDTSSDLRRRSDSQRGRRRSPRARLRSGHCGAETHSETPAGWLPPGRTPLHREKSKCATPAVNPAK